jgi:predicted amidophosphoribosyltransferase
MDAPTWDFPPPPPVGRRLKHYRCSTCGKNMLMETALCWQCARPDQVRTIPAADDWARGARPDPAVVNQPLEVAA